MSSRSRSCTKRSPTLSRDFPEIYTELPGPHDEGYPHAANWSNWVKGAAPHATLKDVSSAVGTLRAIKTPGELALIQKAIDPSIDAQLAAMKMMRSGLYEYQVAAKMVEIHAAAGCETEAYAPIVGSGFNSTVLHYNKLDRQIDGGEVVLLDVAGQYSGYAADITRTIPADGKFSPRQREIYEIVLGAQNAALAALKPGMTIGGQGDTSLQKIAMEYIDSHGKDKEGHSLGKYYIHGLSHHVGLDVHDPSGPSRPLEAGHGHHHRAGNLYSRGKSGRAHRGRRAHHAHRIQIADGAPAAHRRTRSKKSWPREKRSARKRGRSEICVAAIPDMAFLRTLAWKVKGFNTEGTEGHREIPSLLKIRSTHYFLLFSASCAASSSIFAVRRERASTD